MQKREEAPRKAIKVIVPCDIAHDPPVTKGFEGPYDIVISSLFLDGAYRTRSE